MVHVYVKYWASTLLGLGAEVPLGRHHLVVGLMNGFFRSDRIENVEEWLICLDFLGEMYPVLASFPPFLDAPSILDGVPSCVLAHIFNISGWVRPRDFEIIR